MNDKTEIETLSDVFQALSDPTRLKILELLRKNQQPCCVNALALHIGISQSAVSQHLKILRQQGLVSVKKEGYYKHYSFSVENLDVVRLLRETVLGEEFKI